MRKRLGKFWKWIDKPKFWLVGSVVFGVWDLVDAIWYTVMGRTGPAVYNWVLVGLMVWCCQYWARRLREQNGGVLWIPKVKLAQQFTNIGRGPWFVHCRNQYVEVGNGPYYQQDPVMKPGHPDWETALEVATEKVVEKYRKGVSLRKAQAKARRRILKEARRGHRGNAEDDPSGAVEGAGNEPGGQPTAAEIASYASSFNAITTAAGFTIPLFTTASGGLAFQTPVVSQYAITSMGISNDPGLPDPDPEPDEELDTYTIPVWGFRSWNLLDGGVPKLGSLNSGRHVWTPGVNVAQCQAGGYEMKSMAGGLSVTYPSPHHDRSQVPGADCQCGFYSVRDVFNVQPGIIGGVVGWGKVVDGEKGWRAEKAAVAALFRPPWGSVEEQQKVEMLAEMYNVPVCLTLIDLADRTRELAEWMAGDDLLTGSVDE